MLEVNAKKIPHFGCGWKGEETEKSSGQLRNPLIVTGSNNKNVSSDHLPRLSWMLPKTAGFLWPKNASDILSIPVLGNLPVISWKKGRTVGHHLENLTELVMLIDFISNIYQYLYHFVFPISTPRVSHLLARLESWLIGWHFDGVDSVVRIRHFELHFQYIYIYIQIQHAHTHTHIYIYIYLYAHTHTPKKDLYIYIYTVYTYSHVLFSSWICYGFSFNCEK